MKKLSIQTFFDYLSDVEFYIKITLACVLFQWIFVHLFEGFQLTLVSKILIYWGVNLSSYYIIAFLIEKVIKKNHKLTKKLNTRVTKVKSQPYKHPSAKLFFLSLFQNLMISSGVIIILREVHREVNFVENCGWFLLSIVVTDFAFFAHHYWFLHNKKFPKLFKIHGKHHRYRDTSGFVTAYKDFADQVINFVFADMVVLILFGFDFYQLLAWTVVINLFNIEGHSAVSLFFIGSDFHDRHHTNYRGNYGIQGLWDKIFGTFISKTRKTGIFFPSNTLGKYFLEKNKKHINSIKKPKQKAYIGDMYKG
ncbi:hypothetical protein IWQ47_004059 [Aquimarina sp. EL_43]|uniref:sterol desaturase family protein n=1 Tax=unclassified Aquimarina TaxID=2627091 RepID=UPI0018CA1B72|nr:MULTISPECIES: sterol desaturase family protein [unclassified Aquimarina]MBG6132168.1 hypothetical protein [Aquimarina sp. EL_35]MBG6152965.1 hypothetical protein [Aquimarina sp. EL_32]MBG6170972.1 hypothetical protein [Aquimarina sp. EL_43]